MHGTIFCWGCDCFHRPEFTENKSMKKQISTLSLSLTVKWTNASAILCIYLWKSAQFYHQMATATHSLNPIYPPWLDLYNTPGTILAFHWSTLLVASLSVMIISFTPVQSDHNAHSVQKWNARSHISTMQILATVFFLELLSIKTDINSCHLVC